MCACVRAFLALTRLLLRSGQARCPHQCHRLRGRVTGPAEAAGGGGGAFPAGWFGEGEGGGRGEGEAHSRQVGVEGVNVNSMLLFVLTL